MQDIVVFTYTLILYAMILIISLVCVPMIHSVVTI